MASIVPTPPIVRKYLEQSIRVYRHSQDRLARLLRDAQLTDFQEFRYRSLKGQVDDVVRALDAEVKRLDDQNVIPKMYRRGLDVTTAALREQGVNASASKMGNLVHTRAVAAIADQMAMDLLEANRGVERTATRILRATQQRLMDEATIHRQIAEGVIEGRTRRAVSRKLEKSLRERLKTERFVTVNGINFQPKEYAEIVVRTQTREAVTEGAIRGAQEYDVDLFQISVHSGACPICQPLQGKIYSFSGDSSDFPPLTDGVRPPIHPRCEHVLMAYVPTAHGDEEYKRLAEISKDDGVYIHSHQDYTEVMDGRKPARSAEKPSS